jgi:subtilisin family serine protease
LLKASLCFLIILSVGMVIFTAVSTSALAKPDIDCAIVRQPSAAAGMVPDPPVPYAAIYGNEVTVAVLDSGIDSGHKDLTGRVIKSANFTESDTDLDMQGHGTHVAGIIASGVGSEKDAAYSRLRVQLLNVKVVDDNGVVWPSNVARGILWAVDNGAQVINMSFTVPVDSKILSDAVQYAARHGVIMLAAVGNHADSLSYPAAYQDVIAVATFDSGAATMAENMPAGRGDIYLPGYIIYSAAPGNKYAYKSGNSIATACATRMAALKLSESYIGYSLNTCNCIRTELRILYANVTRR